MPYQFYSNSSNYEKLQQLVGEIGFSDSFRIEQLGTALDEDNLQQTVGEFSFPLIFGFVPWGHLEKIRLQLMNRKTDFTPNPANDIRDDSFDDTFDDKKIVIFANFSV